MTTQPFFYNLQLFKMDGTNLYVALFICIIYS